MPTPPIHERLVARLIADAHPVRPLWSPHVRLLLWLALPALGLGVAVKLGLRPDLRAHLREPRFLLELGALCAAGAMAAAVALRAAVPGRTSGSISSPGTCCRSPSRRRSPGSPAPGCSVGGSKLERGAGARASVRLARYFGASGRYGATSCPRRSCSRVRLCRSSAGTSPCA